MTEETMLNALRMDSKVCPRGNGMSERCKHRISADSWGGTKQCTYPAVKNGFCKKHHPDSVAARQEASRKRWENNNTHYIDSLRVKKGGR